MIETNRFFLQKEGVNKIELGIKKGPRGIGKCQKRGSIERKFPTIFKSPGSNGSFKPSIFHLGWLLLYIMFDESCNAV